MTIATTMLNDNQPIDAIVKYTGLSKETIEEVSGIGEFIHIGLE